MECIRLWDSFLPAASCLWVLCFSLWGGPKLLFNSDFSSLKGVTTFNPWPCTQLHVLPSVGNDEFPSISHKPDRIVLRFYTRISSPEKSHNNTRKKIRYFFACVDIANQLLTRHSPFAPLDRVDEWTVKPLWFSIQGRLSELSWIEAAKTLKNPYRSQIVTFKLS